MHIERSEKTIRLEMPSDIRLVDQVMDEVKEFVRSKGVERAPGLGLILRELVNNAVEHGNGNEQSKLVTVLVEELAPMRFKAQVRDQGEGFDHEGLDLRLTEDPNQERSRGLPMVNAYADQLEFADEGREVTAYMTIKKDTGFETIEEDGLIRITPTSDLSSSVAETFRALLVGLLDQGQTRFRFDLAHVVNVDSVALSIFVVFANMVGKKEKDPVLEVVNASDDIRDMFHLTRLSRIYSVI